MIRDCENNCRVCKSCQSCGAGEYRVNEECELCLSCERVGEIPMGTTRVKPVVLRPKFFG